MNDGAPHCRLPLRIFFIKRIHAISSEELKIWGDAPGVARLLLAPHPAGSRSARFCATFDFSSDYCPDDFASSGLFRMPMKNMLVKTALIVFAGLVGSVSISAHAAALGWPLRSCS